MKNTFFKFTHFLSVVIILLNILGEGICLETFFLLFICLVSILINILGGGSDYEEDGLAEQLDELFLDLSFEHLD